ALLVPADTGRVRIGENEHALVQLDELTQGGQRFAYRGRVHALDQARGDKGLGSVFGGDLVLDCEKDDFARITDEEVVDHRERLCQRCGAQLTVVVAEVRAQGIAGTYGTDD